MNHKASLQCGFIMAFPQAGHIWAPNDLFEMLSFIGKIRPIMALGSYVLNITTGTFSRWIHHAKICKGKKVTLYYNGSSRVKKMA